MSPHDPIEALEMRVHPWTFAETLSAIEARIESKTYTTHTQLNIAKWVAAHRDPDFSKLISKFSIVNVDGMGLLWGAKFLGVALPERVAGIDLFASLVARASQKNWRVFLLGGTEDVAKASHDKFKTQFPNLTIAHHHGYFWGKESELVEEIRNFAPELIFVGITSPKQEAFIEAWGPKLGASFVMGVGGSLDVISGNKTRAPRWVQKAGLEWFYRMIQEPKRLGPRYLVTNLQFAGYVITRWIKRR